MNFVNKLLKRYIQNRFKVWGVGFETDLPPEIVVSEHAEMRLIQRMNIKKDKIAKITMKAWASNNLDPKIVEATKNYRSYFFGKKDIKGKIYKEIMGYTFVFKYTKSRGPLPPQKVLITIW